MAKTIIQTIGPLYGEVVNGTVFGRPNGSVYVPSANRIAVSLPDASRYIAVIGTNYTLSNSAGTPVVAPPNGLAIVAESQDLQNYIVTQVSLSGDFATIEGSRARTAGQFNLNIAYIAQGADLAPIEDETTYYVRAVLMSAGGDPVATSEVIEVTGVVVE